MVYTFLMVYTMVCTFIFGIYRDICNFSSLTCFFCYHSQVVILDKLARYRFPPSLRTARHDHKTSHSMIFWIGALGTGKTTIMHCQRAVQAAERVPGRGIRCLNLVTACLDSKLQILMHCCVIFRYQHLVMCQEWQLTRLLRYTMVYTMVYTMLYTNIYKMIYTVPSIPCLCSATEWTPNSGACEEVQDWSSRAEGPHTGSLASPRLQTSGRSSWSWHAWAVDELYCRGRERWTHPGMWC